MLKNGVPSEATLCRVENGIDDSAMADRMQEFTEGFSTPVYTKPLKVQYQSAFKSPQIIFISATFERTSKSFKISHITITIKQCRRRVS